jgi:hypothetical protein
MSCCQHLSDQPINVQIAVSAFFDFGPRFFKTTHLLIYWTLFAKAADQSSPMITISSLYGGEGFAGKSGRKTANACDASAKETNINTAAHFMFAAKNAFTEDPASLCSLAANLCSDTLAPILSCAHTLLTHLSISPASLCHRRTANGLELAKEPLSGGRSCSC